MTNTYLKWVALFALLTQTTLSINLTDGLVAYYPFNGNAQDASGHGLHGQVFGASLTTDRFGQPNQAFSFDGVDDYILIGDPVPLLLRIQTSISYSVWIYFTSLPPDPGDQCQF